MDEKLLTKLLSERTEKDWLEFKSKFKLYKSDGALVEMQKDEFIKDILGLANGNSHIIRKTKYLSLVLMILSLIKTVAESCMMLITRLLPRAI